MNSRSPLLWILLVLLLVSLTPAFADRGMVAIADVSVYGPGQKAIVAWNGRVEVMILSTDVYAASRTTVLEVLPLPSQPDLIEKTNFSAFERIQGLLGQHGSFATRGKGADSGVNILFHERLGAHDITVVEVSDSSQFEEWVNIFLQERKVAEGIDSSKLAYYVDTYIQDGMPYFVLDLIEVSSEPRSIEPIVYRFRSASLYFPLRISAVSEGDVDVTIFAIGEGQVLEGDLPAPLSLAKFRDPIERPVRFRLNGDQLDEIDPRIRELFDGDAWLTAIKYSGPLKDLSADLSIQEPKATLSDLLVSSHVFWLACGVAIGVAMGLLLAQISMGVLRIDFWRLVSALDFIGLLIFIILASVLSYDWSAYVFWVLVPLAAIALYLTVRTGGRRILVIYLGIPLLAVLLLLAIIAGRLLETVIVLIFFVAFVGAAAFPPSGRRELSRALRESSRWIVASTRRRRL